MRARFLVSVLAVVSGATAMSAGAAREPTVTVTGRSDGVLTYRKSFGGVVCRVGGVHAVSLKATDGGEFELEVIAKKLPGTLVIAGGDGEDAVYFKGRVATVSFAGSRPTRRVTVKGRFAPGGITGVFTLTGDCP